MEKLEFLLSDHGALRPRRQAPILSNKFHRIDFLIQIVGIGEGQLVERRIQGLKVAGEKDMGRVNESRERTCCVLGSFGFPPDSKKSRFFRHRLERGREWRPGRKGTMTGRGTLTIATKT